MSYQEAEEKASGTKNTLASPLPRELGLLSLHAGDAHPQRKADEAVRKAHDRKADDGPAQPDDERCVADSEGKGGVVVRRT